NTTGESLSYFLDSAHDLSAPSSRHFRKRRQRPISTNSHISKTAHHHPPRSSHITTTIRKDMN
ncbi:hypothetical protein CLAFUW4_14100, partial [Fulvia fulva]